MKITLLRTGGIIPILKKASTEVDWSESELDQLIALIKADENPGKMRDNLQYQLVYKDHTFSIDPEKIPQKYKKTFESLKDNLQIVKQG